MITARLRDLYDSIRPGVTSGFIVGVIIVFLILIGVPITLENVALLTFFVITFVFGVRLAHHLRDEGGVAMLRNSLAMGVVAALLPYLLMSLVNNWQAQGIDVKQYFDQVNAETMSVLSGVPVNELHANPPIDVLTGEYVEGQPLRTDPMRLTFGSERALYLAAVELNLGVGGFYGFMLLLVACAVAGTMLTWAAFRAEVGRYWAQLRNGAGRLPLVHWILLASPLLTFLVLRLTEPQGGRGSVLSGVASSSEAQLMLSFGVILFALVALRAANRADWGLAYPLRVGAIVGVIALVTVLGIWRIADQNAYFLAPSGSQVWDTPLGSVDAGLVLSGGALILVAAIIALQSVLAVRDPSRFETQFAGAEALMALAVLPLFLDQYQNDVLTLVGIYILLGLGLNIVVGYAGLLDLGYVAFFALGAYSYAFLSSNQEEYAQSGASSGLKFAGNDEMVISLAGSIVLATLITAIVVGLGLMWWRRRTAQAASGASRTLVDLPARPSTSVSLLLILIAVATTVIVTAIAKNVGLFDEVFGGSSPFLIGLVAGVIVSGLAGILLGIPVLRLRGDYLAIVTLGFGEIIRLLLNNQRDLTGGPQGVLQIPRPLPGSVSYLAIVYLVLLGAGLIAFLSHRLKQSRTGRAWTAMRSDEDIAQSMGVNLVQSKLTAFAIGAACAGVGGVLFAARQRNIFPADFRLDVSINVLSVVIIGGMGSIPGVIMGAVVLIGIPEVLRGLATYRVLAFGALLVMMVIIRPEGLLPAPPARLSDRARGLAQRFTGVGEKGSAR